MRGYTVLSAIGAVAVVAVTASATATCGAGSPCPESAPCCSEYGQCGVGAYCLGGCDPLYSYNLDSCVPRPTCQSSNYEMTSLSDVESNTVYLGDASKANWVSSGTPAVYTDPSSGQKSVLLTMAPGSVGTLLSSTHYVWYGKISATLKTSAGQGVVTAFIMMSDVKDEIDFEFVGADLQHAQSNFYYQGITDYTNGENLTAANTNTDSHTYEFDWQPESITWSVDGSVLRTLKKSDTYNNTDDSYHFPQTPSRVQLSLWPAGEPKSAPGTIAWAGGLINWNSQYMSNGYYYAQVMDVSVECYNPPSDANVTGSDSYVYNSDSGTEDSVAITNEPGILSSFYATGNNEDYNPNGNSGSGSSASASASGSASPAATPSGNVGTVPGLNVPAGAGVRGGSGSGSSGSSSGTGSSGSTGASSNSGYSGSGFSQGTDNNGNSAPGKGERAMQGSALAVVVAVLGCMIL